jgi:hypothetical protein
MLLNGDQYQFRVDSLPYGENDSILLNFVENDSLGMKFTGSIPFLWEFAADTVLGPRLYDDDHTYQVAGVDYGSRTIWLRELS